MPGAGNSGAEHKRFSSDVEAVAWGLRCGPIRTALNPSAGAGIRAGHWDTGEGQRTNGRSKRMRRWLVMIGRGSVRESAFKSSAPLGPPHEPRPPASYMVSICGPLRKTPFEVRVFRSWQDASPHWVKRPSTLAVMGRRASECQAPQESAKRLLAGATMREWKAWDVAKRCGIPVARTTPCSLNRRCLTR